MCFSGKSRLGFALGALKHTQVQPSARSCGKEFLHLLALVSLVLLLALSTTTARAEAKLGVNGIFVSTTRIAGATRAIIAAQEGVKVQVVIRLIRAKLVGTNPGLA